MRVFTAIFIATVFNTTDVECKGLEEADFNVFRFNQCPLASLRIHLLFDLTPRQCAYECAVRASCKGAGYSPGFKCCEIFDVEEVNSTNSDDRRCNFIRKSDISAVEGVSNCATGERYNRNANQCEKRECPPVEPVKNGVILGNSFELDSRRMVRCNLGYCEKTGQTTMLCLNGNWNYTPECVPSPCTSPLSPTKPTTQPSTTTKIVPTSTATITSAATVTSAATTAAAIVTTATITTVATFTTAPITTAATVTTAAISSVATATAAFTTAAANTAANTTVTTITAAITTVANTTATPTTVTNNTATISTATTTTAATTTAATTTAVTTTADTPTVATTTTATTTTITTAVITSATTQPPITITPSPSITGTAHESSISTQTEQTTNDVNGCTTSPCKNGGACENLFDGFKCTCAGEWLGRNCNVNGTHNVAVGKNSKQTDTANGRAAAFGNDGNMSTCTETTSSDASWEVDLGGVFQIESVIVRGDEEGQWISRVLTFSSEYSPSNWSAQQIIGVPNVFPVYGDKIQAWAPKDIDANQFLEFEFPNKVKVSKIDIYETYHAGGVKAVKCYDVTGTWVTLWSTAQVSVIKHSRIFSPSFTSTTTCFSNHIRLDIDCSQANSWVEIDAVMLHGYKDVEVYLGLSDGVYSLEGFCNWILDGDCEVQVSGENLVQFVQVKMRPSEAPLQLCEVLVLGFK